MMHDSRAMLLAAVAVVLERGGACRNAENTQHTRKHNIGSVPAVWKVWCGLSPMGDE